MATKSKKKHRPVVRGPQKALPLKVRKVKPARSLGAANGETAVTGIRLPLVHEGKVKRTGNPFVAFRVPRELLAHWKAWLKKKSRSNGPAMREAMAKLSGYRGETEGDNDAE